MCGWFFNSQSPALSFILCSHSNLQIQDHLVQIAIDFSLFSELFHTLAIFDLLLIFQILSHNIFVDPECIRPKVIFQFVDLKIRFFGLKKIAIEGEIVLSLNKQAKHLCVLQQFAVDGF